MIRQISLLVVALTLQSCGIAFMRKAEGQVALTEAPAGKALVNFHRPSSYGGGASYEVFDREKLIGNTKGSMRFQYVCDPGEHVFIGSAQKGSAIKADLGAGQVYDVGIHVSMGMFRANIWMEPVTDEQRGELADWEGRETLWELVDDKSSQKFESKRQGWAQETLNDFLNGSHRESLQTIAASAHR